MNDDEMVCRKRKHVFLFVDCAVYKGDRCVCGEKARMDCSYVGRLSGTKGTVWQYSAADVASGYAWAFLKRSERNPRSRCDPTADA